MFFTLENMQENSEERMFEYLLIFPKEKFNRKWFVFVLIFQLSPISFLI